ncbi:MAG TPA: DNA repair protein RecN, partial [Acidimicrobiales bacterium]|nr:DNA repair protein RecN [Acidimicrobiales bacterium]
MTSAVGSALIELRVRNLGVIDDVTITLEPGMTALTGETGAGKTLVVEALSLLLGDRADPTVIRSGTDEALVEGRFARGPDDEDEVVLARAVVRNGRSKAWIDGRMATVGALGEVARELIELHGQHQHQTLVHTDSQRRALDAFGQIDLTGLEAARIRLRRLTDESQALGGDARQRAREVDLLRYQIEEIDEAAIEDGDEDRRLEIEEDRLAASTAHRQAAAEALDAVSAADGTNALDLLAAAAQALSGRVPLADIEARVSAAMADLSDLSIDLRTVVETWEDDPKRLEEIRSRRQQFHQLMRKYGDSLAEVLAFAGQARQRLEAIAVEEERSGALDQEILAALRTLEAAEADVARLRRQASPLLAAAIETTLHTLAMPSARFSIAVDGPGAADQVTFLLGANPGEPLQPVAKAASGGELARTMLAIRLAISDSPGLMVFDEVDAGVGGAAATAVGAALAGLGDHGQVVVVTHLAQVAAQADHQVEVRKSERGGRTRSTVVALDTEGRVTELSRMLSGHPDSSSAQLHARE